ncbi:hypothetical protein CQR48_0966 [Bifidobacterium thermophilum]|uniref:DUF2058 domain-containing protein n=1 Tax=Bifidobacterium thermophilum TaxID=33905 RepID=UPI000CC69768|nr:DUF2058 domain-containing protein [Bifidobacterium thermophilum]PKU90112.1 hypothetical protein CQR48_0966 [Bifidobacterium thermophilum]
MGPWDWTLSTTIATIALAFTAIGWVITAIKDKKTAKTTEKRHNEQLATLKDQLQTERDSATALRAQAESSATAAKAAQEQVRQLQEANRIAMAANPPDKAPWGDAEWVRGELFRMRNEGNRNVIVTAVRASDPKLQGLFHFSESTPFKCEPGDSIVYIALGTGQIGAPKTEIRWHWEGDGMERTTVRPNIKPKL